MVEIPVPDSLYLSLSVFQEMCFNAYPRKFLNTGPGWIQDLGVGVGGVWGGGGVEAVRVTVEYKNAEHSRAYMPV